METRSEVYSGLVPHPEHARAFEEIQPGSFDRFISMAERQGGHGQWMENGFLLLNGLSQFVGVGVAGTHVLAGMYHGHDLLMNDKPMEGFTAMLAPLGVVGAAFLSERRSRRLEKARKAAAEQG